MPIYAYKCKDCGEEAEYIQKFSDPPMTVCETCGGHIEKQITAAAFHLKGGGWYKDGYASAKAGGGAEPKAATPESSKDSGDKQASKSKPAKASSASSPGPAKSSKGSKKSA